ncbi:MAG: hypothetical protein M3Y77_02650 [Actinomycetota bacterium]|nr:hypothetical protein [Actinomycetota bacterium]
MSDQPTEGLVTDSGDAAVDDRRTERIPAVPATPPPGGPDDPEKRRVTPIAHPPVTLPPNPPAPVPPRQAGVNEIIIGVAGIAAFVSTFLSWQSHDFGGWSSAWSTGLWPAGVLGLVAALFHLARMLPPADKAFGALLPLLLCTAAVWIPIAALPDNGDAWGVWLCLIAGIVLTGCLLVAAMSDPALRRADDPNDFFN